MSYFARLPTVELLPFARLQSRYLMQALCHRDTLVKEKAVICGGNNRFHPCIWKDRSIPPQNGKSLAELSSDVACAGRKRLLGVPFPSVASRRQRGGEGEGKTVIALSEEAVLAG